MPSFHVIKYNSLVYCQQGSNPQGAKAMRLGVQKKDKDMGICVSKNGAHGGECEQ